MRRLALWFVIGFPLAIAVCDLKGSIAEGRGTYFPNRAVVPSDYRDRLFREMPEHRFFHQGSFRGTLILGEAQTVAGPHLILLLDKAEYAMSPDIAIEVPLPNSFPARIPITSETSVYWQRMTRVTGEVTLERGSEDELSATIDLEGIRYFGPYSLGSDSPRFEEALKEFEGLTQEDVLGQKCTFQWTTILKRSDSKRLVHREWRPMPTCT